MPKLDFNKVLSAILLIREVEKMPLRELAKQYAEFSKQEITEEMLKEWSMTGLGNEYFLTSDFLQKFDFMPIQHVKIEPVAVESGDSAVKYQIGNIVGVDNPKHHSVLKGVPLKIVGLPLNDGELCAQLDDEELCSYSQRLKYVTGIPITEEWLLKFGFEKIYNSDRSTVFTTELNDHFLKYEFWISSGVSHLVYEGKNIQCDFVHELQNKVYALTDVELKISE